MVSALSSAPAPSEIANDPDFPRLFTEAEFQMLRQHEPSLFPGEFPELIDGRIILNGDSPKLWTFDQFQELAREEPFEDLRLELIDGEIYEMDGLPNPPHDVALSLADYALKEVFGKGYVVRIGAGFRRSYSSGVMPDVSVLKGNPRDIRETPTGALLIVEISDSTLRKDKSAKASLYAKAGIEDYWIIDVKNRQLIVHRQPDGSRYAEVRFLKVGESVSPLAKPEASIAVVDLLP